MGTYEMGTLIRTLRLQKGWSQEKLCGDFLSVSTLSRAEAGIQVLSKANFEAIMQRLGINAENYFSIFLGAKEYDIYSRIQELEQLLTEQEYEKALEKISYLENDENFLNGLNLQFLLSSKVCVRLFKDKFDQMRDEDFDDLMSILLDAIRISNKGFDETKISNYILSNEEMRIINQIAILYYRWSKIERAIAVLYSLRENINANYKDHMDKMDMYIKILYNLSKYLGLSMKFKEALEICNLGIKICKETGRLVVLPFLIFNKAYILKELGDEEPCVRLLKQAAYSLDMQGEFGESKKIRLYAKESISIEL